jgi:2-polyprenyl-3-methyl-5-hydroxy-6-metoxy-1,4-benzoquinol methylase/thioredoxin-like negative regulator of GroEL
MEYTLDQALQKGVEAHKAGKVQEADRYYTAILKANPNHPDANHNMGVLAVGIGKVETALPFFKTALDTNPNIDQFWISYIDALIKLDRLDEASEVFKTAKTKGVKGNGFEQLKKRLSLLTDTFIASQKPISKKSKILESPKLRQAIEMADGKTKSKNYEQAATIYKDILEKFPKNDKALNGLIDLGLTDQYKKLNIQDPPTERIKILNDLYAKGQMQQVLADTSGLLSQFPKSSTLYNILGMVNFTMNKKNEALEAFITALSIKPGYKEVYYNLSIALTGVTFKKPYPDLLNIINMLLNKQSYVRPKDIAPAAISLLRFQPQLKKYLQKFNKYNKKPKSLRIISELNKLPLLLRLMSLCPLNDLELEQLFTELRADLVVQVSVLEGSPELYKFQSALALQCFANEYIYNKTNDEDRAIAALEKLIEQMLQNNKQPSPQILFVLASYKPLNKYAWCDSLALKNEIRDVYIRQIEEPKNDQKIKKSLPVLKDITDKISSKVGEQYEESPYPQWVNLGLRLEPASVSKVFEEVKLKLFNETIKKVKSPDILIAGCGTGQHSIGTARRFKNSKVFAVDLSLASLSYAKRKTKELGVENIHYMQADILDLERLNKKFDIIESSGVLHHMYEPMAGWTILTKCLKPGGMMKIGLYSELARQHIIKIRKEISKSGIKTNKEEIRLFRKKLIKSNEEHHKLIISSPDFYSFSSIKDLLFHVQEHRFTIPLIETHLKKLGLKFCGFDSNKIVSQFKLSYPGKDDPFDLEKWHAFEKARPRTFAGMYQFWCQKVN